MHIAPKTDHEVNDNAYLDLRYTNDLFYQPYSSPNVKVHFKDGASDFVSINTKEGAYLQTKLCCYPEKEKIYEIKLQCRNSAMNQKKLKYIALWFLDNPYQLEQPLPAPSLLLNIEDEDWTQCLTRVKLEGKERYILIRSIPIEYRPENKQEYQGEGYFFGLDIKGLSLVYSQDNLKEAKARSKMEF